MEAIIVPCTQEKIWDAQPDIGAVAAKEAYTKSAFRSWRKHAEQSGKPWFILSTKYGLVEPNQKIEKYNVPVSTAVADPAFLNRLEAQGRQLGLAKFDQLVLLDFSWIHSPRRSTTRITRRTSSDSSRSECRHNSDFCLSLMWTAV